MSIRGSQKSKRVSWASDGKLCQVQLFLSEDPPSQVGSSAQENLKAKRTSRILQTSNVLQSTKLIDDSLPPGFEEFSPANQLKNKLAHLPLAIWACPPRFMINSTWRVVAGEESREVEIQNQREMRVLEAIYPRLSAIPPNAADSLDTTPVFDDRATPLIPITPIEEEEAVEDVPPGYAPVSSASVGSMATESSHGALPSSHSISLEPMRPLKNGSLAAGMAVDGQVNGEARITPDASAALAALMKSNGPGSLIDHDLLVRIIGNSGILDALVSNQGASSSIQNAPLSLEPPSQMAPQQMPASMPIHNQTPFPINGMEAGSSASVVTSSGPIGPPINGMPFAFHHNPTPLVGGVAQVPYAHSRSASPAKDTNYYKSLIQQHGGEKHPETLPAFGGGYGHLPGQSPDLTMNSKPRDSRPKSTRPCIYFNSSKGCRHGSNCVYQHDVSVQQRFENNSVMQSSKRHKMDRDGDIRGPQTYS